jgi:hypothetical protein
MRVDAAFTGGSGATITVDSTSNVDLRVGGLAAVYKDSTTFDVLTVNSTTSTTITFSSNITQSYAVGDLVIPVRLAHARPSVSGQRYPLNLETIDMDFRVLDNDTGVVTGDTTPYNTYNSKVLLDDCNYLTGTMSEGYTQDIVVLDNVSGLVFQDSIWEKNKRQHQKTFLTKTRVDLWQVRRLLYALRGRQVSFYIPTFADDLEVTQNLVSGQATMVIKNINYVRFAQDRTPKKDFKITFTDDSSLTRSISSSTETSATEETLTLNDTWPANRNVSEIDRVEFLEPVRMASDSVTIEHGALGQARITFPVVTVFDHD